MTEQTTAPPLRRYDGSTLLARQVLAELSLLPEQTSYRLASRLGARVSDVERALDTLAAAGDARPDNAANTWSAAS